ncbi:bacillithiol system redox-active protein YtxJ [Flavobacterium aquatile]|uniref:General stress protein n=1 Tax=Flavobacterium aquatile LMG 4008 = ATCC 11947 TaxID=1453498 RepID=A0A095UY90_9FLAO|nr:bacillithiol system redox-active protein YtxJ [Flavobacterium aquatile]KGD67545.1 general stress protein [Flavobacterium aquatile LMG 4008 = ATCC 11947]OXA65522.1 thioredoxin family protein [Flavobacterium aquatile LMG 4008 = ATCC 11947]GEC80097.1 thioredoxin family protein [Flavobacterium aquatile]
MSLFKNIFGSQDEENKVSKVDWRMLTNVDDLNEIVNESAGKPILIFKHSTRCSISRMVLKQFENEFDLQDKITPYFLDLLNHRDVSNEIATKFDVYHQSPQLIVIQDGKSIYDVSHDSIDAHSLKKFV